MASPTPRTAADAVARAGALLSLRVADKVIAVEEVDEDENEEEEEVVPTGGRRRRWQSRPLSAGEVW